MRRCARASATGMPSEPTITRSTPDRELLGRDRPRLRLRAAQVPARQPDDDQRRTVDKDGPDAAARPGGPGHEDRRRDDPESPLRWAASAVRRLARTLQTIGHRISTTWWPRSWTAVGYSEHASQTTREGPPHPDRRAQDRGSVTEQVRQFAGGGSAGVSPVDTKKKDLVGNFTTARRAWRPGGPTETSAGARQPHRRTGQANRGYAVDDRARNAGRASVGSDHDTQPASPADAWCRCAQAENGAPAYRARPRA